MKAIVVYYTLDGNSKYVADEIAQGIGADTLRLETVKTYPTGPVSKRFWAGMDIMSGEAPELKPYHFDASRYDVVVIGSPNWTHTFAAPIKTFINENDLSNKKVAFYVCSGSGKSEKCFERLKQALPKTKVVASLSLKYPKQEPSQEKRQEIKAFCDEIKKH